MNQLTQQGLFVIEGRATYERIVNYIRDVEAEEAIRQIQNFLKVYPEFAQAHNDLAVLYYRAGNGMKALAHYEKSHKLEPANITYRKNLADFYFVELEWTDDAIQTYLEILKDNPFDVETLNALGTITAQTGRREQARQYFSRTLQLDAVNSQARQALQQLGGQLPQAPQHLKIDNTSLHTRNTSSDTTSFQAPATSPSVKNAAVSAELLHKQSIELTNSGKNPAACRLLEELIVRYPHYAAAHNDLGVLYQQEGNFAQARSRQEEALRLKPDNLNFQKNLADLLYIAYGETEEALKLYVKILGSNPHDIETLKAISNICIESGKLEDARSFQESILRIEPWNIEAQESLASLSDSKDSIPPSVPDHNNLDAIHAEALQLIQEDRLIEAQSLLEELVHVKNENALYHNDLGVICYRLGDNSGALRSYEQAVELQSDNVSFRKNLADLYFIEFGRFDDAIAIYLDLLNKFPRDLEVLIGLGVISLAVGHPDEAKAFYRRALEIAPWNADIRSALQELIA